MTTALRPDTLRADRQARLRAALPVHVERLGWDAGRVRAHQEHALRRLLDHARAHSPFHAERLRGVDTDRFGLDDLAALPPMTKTEMMADLDRVLTDRRLSRAALEDHLAGTGDEARELRASTSSRARAAAPASAGSSPTAPARSSTTRSG